MRARPPPQSGLPPRPPRASLPGCAWGLLELGDYHEWKRETPVLDAVGSIVAVGSVIVGGHAALFLAAALRDGNYDLALDNAQFFVFIAVANGTVDGLRFWRRHHG